MEVEVEVEVEVEAEAAQRLRLQPGGVKRRQGAEACLRLQPEGIEVVQVSRPERGGVGDLTEQPAARPRSSCRSRSPRGAPPAAPPRGARRAAVRRGVDASVAECVDVRDARQPEAAHRDQLHVSAAAPL